MIDIQHIAHIIFSWGHPPCRPTKHPSEPLFRHFFTPCAGTTEELEPPCVQSRYMSMLRHRHRRSLKYMLSMAELWCWMPKHGIGIGARYFRMFCGTGRGEYWLLPSDKKARCRMAAGLGFACCQEVLYSALGASASATGASATGASAAGTSAFLARLRRVLLAAFLVVSLSMFSL